jgi:hypothetical protein
MLTASSPAVLGMAATVMPDIAAMLFAILGIERILAWRDSRKWPQAAAATFWMTLAALTRTHTILLLAPVCVLLLDGISVDEIRTSLRVFPQRFLPVLLTPILYWIAGAITADPDSQGENILSAMLRMPGGLHLIAQNGIAFLAHWVIVVPLTIPWLWIRFRKIPVALMLVPLAGAFALAFRLGWVAFAVGATVVVMADIFWDAILRRDRVQLALWTWLFLAAPVVAYLHLPSKYLLPSVPAAAILVVRLMPQEAARARWAIPSTALAGVLLGLLILLGIRDLARIQKRAVSELIEPAMKTGERVWFSGHWGFQWYAEQAGATPVVLEPPFPQPNDVIVVSEIDFPTFSREWKARSVERRVCYASSGPGRIMDFPAGAGFFSSPFGYLPWVPGSGDASCFEVWRVL